MAFLGAAFLVGIGMFSAYGTPPLDGATIDPAAMTEPAQSWTEIFPPQILLVVFVLLCCSAFFSGSETAFFSIHKIRLRSMREEGSVGGALVAKTMDHPGRLLTTILVGNTIVNVLIGIFLGSHVQDLLSYYFPTLPEAGAYVLAVALCTSVLVFFGEISPKVFAVRMSERIARVAVFPLLAADRALAPIRDSLLWMTEALFRLTRFRQLHAAPFITDDELRTVLTDGEAQGVIEDDERQMIEGILEFSDAQLREILVPRPDVISLSEDTTVAEALDTVRQHEYSRMPVYRDSLDTVVGVLLAKDLIPCIARGELQRTIKGLIKPVHFVPAMMTVQQFVADAQRHRAHLAVVVDEYGGTAGIVTLEDAVEQVVGEIMDEDEQEEPGYLKLGESEYQIEGGMPLDELSELLGVDLQDDEHETLGGFLMAKSEKILESGDEIDYEGVRFTVEACDGKRVSSVRAYISKRDPQETEPTAGSEAGAT
ncbi:MAG: hemolysin family protein [Candidatus Hydrogenedentes bacterium]|nr:hemolysin family protein [Candidatus Hydrogenedentota bacterium]